MKGNYCAATNKVIPHVVIKKGKTIELPFKWVEDRSGEVCYIDKGCWGARNYMVIDVVGYFFLLNHPERDSF